MREAALSNWNEVTLSTVSASEIPTKDRLGTIKEVPQWIKKYHELIVADGFSHLWSSFIKICMLQVLIGNIRDPFDQMLAKTVQA